jgi:ProP effector
MDPLQAFAVFSAEVRPLKIGIHCDLRARCPGVTRTQLRRALDRYVNRANYWQTMVEGAARYDLDGQEAGVVTAKEAAQAARRLAKVITAKPAKAAPEPPKQTAVKPSLKHKPLLKLPTR